MIVFKSRVLHKMKIYEYGFSTLLKCKTLFNIHFGKKMLSVDRFSKFLQVLLRQMEISMVTRTYFSCPDLSKKSSKNQYQMSDFYTIDLQIEIIQRENTVN